MSDLISKKALILQALAEPGGGDLGNPEIAKRVGCDAKLVRSVRAEVETDRLREENERLNVLVADLLGQLAVFEAAQPATAAPVRRKSRKAKVEFYPLLGDS